MMNIGRHGAGLVAELDTGGVSVVVSEVDMAWRKETP